MAYLRAFHNICPYDGCLAVRTEQRGAKAIEVYYHGGRCDPHGHLLAALYQDGRRRGIRRVSKGAPISSRSGLGRGSICSSWILAERRVRGITTLKNWFVSLYPNVAMSLRVNTFRLEVCLPESPDCSRILQCGSFHRGAPASPDFPAYHGGLAERYAQVFEEGRIAIEVVQRARSSPVWRQQFYAQFWDALHYVMSKLVADDVSWPNAVAPEPLSDR